MNRAKYLKKENLKWPVMLTEVDRREWPRFALASGEMPIRVLRSRSFLVQIYIDRGFDRISVIRTELSPGGRFRDGITWDELMRLKDQAGYGDRWAVEIFPPQSAVINVANMRHLFVLKEPPPYGWKNARD
jgi:hypothetical protein